MNRVLIATAVALACSGCMGDAQIVEMDGPPVDERQVEQNITCSPQMNHSPINGPHNIGYDSASCGGSCDISCPDQNANSDYGGAHHGIDVFAYHRAEIVAVAAGTITAVGWPSSTSGLRVNLADDCGWWYYYGHLDEAVVHQGQRVEPGQLIGYMGKSGAASVHLHFNVNPNGNYYSDINPFDLLNATSATACGGGVGGDGCSAQQRQGCAAYGSGCVDNQCNGGTSPGTGCTAAEASGCAMYGSNCVDHQCNGGTAPGTGCTWRETHDCAQYGSNCVDHQCNGGTAPGTGCTWRETHDCAQYGSNCVDHQCNGGTAPGTGCTWRETHDCAQYGSNCVDHQCNGGTAEGSGCTWRETHDCGQYGCGCVDHGCNGGACAGNGCTVRQVSTCNSANQSCQSGVCK